MYTEELVALYVIIVERAVIIHASFIYYYSRVFSFSVHLHVHVRTIPNVEITNTSPARYIFKHRRTNSQQSVKLPVLEPVVLLQSSPLLRTLLGLEKSKLSMKELLLDVGLMIADWGSCMLTTLPSTAIQLKVGGERERKLELLHKTYMIKIFAMFKLL